MNLDFKGPYHFDNIGSINGINSSGIYIWGFTAKRNANGVDYDIDDCKDNPQLKPNGIVDFDNDQLFIPYYVGIATGKSEVTISRRLGNHRLPLSGNGLKYTRLTNGYLKGVQSSSSLDNWIKKSITISKNEVSYFNNCCFINKIYNQYPICLKDNYPIDLQISNGIPIYDSLEEFIVKRNNFSFIFVTIEEDDLQDLFGNANFKTKLSFLESFIFYSLKGITISDCHLLSTVRNKIVPQLISQNTSLIQLSASNCNCIFKIIGAIAFKKGKPSDFPGDY